MHPILSCLLCLAIVNVTLAAYSNNSTFYPIAINDISSTHSIEQSITSLYVNDQAGSANNWESYIEFYSTTSIYSGLLIFNVGNISVSSITFTCNFRGQPFTEQGWAFDIMLNRPTQYIQIGDTNPNINGWNSWSNFNFTTLPSVDLSRAIDEGRNINIRFRSLKANDASQLDFAQLVVYANPIRTNTSSPPSPTRVPAIPTSMPGNTSNHTDAPTTSPSYFVSLRVLVLASSSSASGIDVVKLTFDGVGTPYDIVTVSSSTSLSSYLSASGSVGRYSSVVSITKTLLSASQQQTIIDYQKRYGIRWAVMESDPSGLTGVSALASTSTKGTLTLAPQFYTFASPLNTALSIDTQYSVPWQDQNPATLTPATITDSSKATPAILYNGDKVAAVQITYSDGTSQLHYFIKQNSNYFFARIFSTVLLNWLSPSGIFIGQRRVFITPQADDLFLASNLWDPVAHKNPLSDSRIYRITANDIESASQFLDNINAELPAKSHVTIELPYNGAGTGWYQQPDLLYAKTKQLQDKFHFTNIDFTPSFLASGMASPYLSNNSLVNPCITGLFNGNVLKAMADNGIKYAVGDNTVTNLVPANKYHGITTTVAQHGYGGIFIIPRDAYDIGYDTSNYAEFVDQYQTLYKLAWDFERIMKLQVDYFMERKTAFRNDASMFHQANLRFFTYQDPITGTSRQVSLTTLWMERVIRQTLSYYTLPVVTPKFEELANIWLQREAMDNCGLQATLEIRHNKVVGITITSSKSCTATLSGVEISDSRVTMEYASTEKTAFLAMTPNQPLTLSLK